MLDVKTTVKVPKQIIKPEMLVKFNPQFFPSYPDDIGIVVQVTKKLVHVLWLVNTSPGEIHSTGVAETPLSDAEKQTFFKTRGKHHYVTEEKRRDLIPAPAGTTVTITQTEK